MEAGISTQETKIRVLERERERSESARLKSRSGRPGSESYMPGPGCLWLGSGSLSQILDPRGHAWISGASNEVFKVRFWVSEARILSRRDQDLDLVGLRG